MKKALLITGSIIAFIALLIWSLPEPIESDLTQIGNGKQSVVFIYEMNLVVSNQQTIEINKIKPDLANSVNFLVTRTGYPATDEFMHKYNAEGAEIFFFDEKGKLFKRDFALISAADLKTILAGEN
jgi:hypothetical protein